MGVTGSLKLILVQLFLQHLKDHLLQVVLRCELGLFPTQSIYRTKESVKVLNKLTVIQELKYGKYCLNKCKATKLEHIK